MLLGVKTADWQRRCARGYHRNVTLRRAAERAAFTPPSGSPDSDPSWVPYIGHPNPMKMYHVPTMLAELI